MPKRTDISKIMIIGAGPIVIGQACEFDYSGTQACKALKEEGYKVVLINSNPATIMTDPELSDSTYIEPITVEVIEEIIKKERPDAILPTMGGQTGLNTALELDKKGILKKFEIELIGANKVAIEMAEDRKKFRDAMDRIGIESPKSSIAQTLREAKKALNKVGLPAVIRPAFTMGGAGGGIAYNEEEYIQICKTGLNLSPVNQIVIDESLLGWKEYEMEVVRDKMDNAIIVCSIENIDPMGVHTGDSITVAPTLTLSDKEFQLMRSKSIEILREIGVETGGSNVQWAVNPIDGRMIVIEMNPRVSRSSALASKATGFPIAKIATKLAIGYTLDELINDITGSTPASFEPTIDYIVTKIPRFAFEKFPRASQDLTTSMKSVGEAMAIGGSIHESLQKALISLETGLNGFSEVKFNGTDEASIIAALSQKSPDRLLRIAEAIRHKVSLEKIYKATHFDPWYLERLSELVKIENTLKKNGLPLKTNEMFNLKSLGFSDSRIGELVGKSENEIREYRWKNNIHPIFRRIDTCSGEFLAQTPYMYSSYQPFRSPDSVCEAKPTEKKKIIILGGGPNRIGQGIEFDYCCCHACFALTEAGYETIMINCNPETVSTDYDTSDRLYFEPLTTEHVMEIIRVEQKKGVLYGVIVQLGGQTPLNLAKSIESYGVKILGTTSESIDIAEDREKFQKLLQRLNLKQPRNGLARSAKQAYEVATEIGFPIIIRPSYVLGGRAMEIVFDFIQLEKYINDAVTVSGENPVLIDSYLREAIEVDVDSLSDGKHVEVVGIMEHIEEAGVHSGDSACSLPPYSLSVELTKQIELQTKKLALGLKVVGLMNVQFAVKENEIYVLEVNPRASRTVPFVSKAIGHPLAAIAAKVMAGESLRPFRNNKSSYFSVKEAVLPFNKFPGTDTLLGPEMRSTGEVMGVSNSFELAYMKAQLGAGVRLPKEGTVFISVKEKDKRKLILETAQILTNLGFKIVATSGTLDFLKLSEIKAYLVKKVYEGRPNIIDLLKDDKINLVINTTEGLQSILDSREIRTVSLTRDLPYYTTSAGALAAVKSMRALAKTEFSVVSLQEIKKNNQ